MKRPERNESDVTRFTASGMAAFLPGMIYMQELIVERMQRSIEQMKQELAMLQQVDQGAVKKRGRPQGVKEASPRKRNSGWPASEEGRRIEIQRRQAVAAAKKAGKPSKLHPRDPRHPEHEAWVAKMGAVQRKRWASFTPAERKAQLRKMSKAGKASHAAATARGAVEELRATA